MPPKLIWSEMEDLTRVTTGIKEERGGGCELQRRKWEDGGGGSSILLMF